VCVQQEQQRLQADLQAVLVASSPTRARSASRGTKSQPRSRRPRRDSGGLDDTGDFVGGSGGGHRLDRSLYSEDEADVDPPRTARGSGGRGRAAAAGGVDRVMVDVDELLARVVASPDLHRVVGEWDGVGGGAAPSRGRVATSSSRR
jgi:hypothetical protein